MALVDEDLHSPQGTIKLSDGSHKEICRSSDLSHFRFGSEEIERLVCAELAPGILDKLLSREPAPWSTSFPSLRTLSYGEVTKAHPIRVCIATEEIVGPVRNGGIGTTYAFLAEMLGKLQIDVTILYLRGLEVENGTIDQWIEHYAEKGVKFVPVPNSAVNDRIQTGADRWLQAPYNMMRYLLDHPFDVVHVSEWRGSAYLCLLAKRQGLAFTKTLFIVKTSSPWLWNRLYGSQPVDRVEDLTKICAERQSVELADIVIGGSAHLLRWMSSQGYKLPAARTFVQPNVVFFDHLKEITATRSNKACSRVAIDEIVFFGRLEARKGIFFFCEAIERLVNYGARLPPKISFMGKPGARLTARPDQDILEYIAETTRNWPCEVQVHTEFQQLEALRYLLGGARLAVMPSVIENSSLAVYEATMCGIPFIASSSGGTPELVAEEDREQVLCEAHPIPLAAKLAIALEVGGYVARPSFDNDENLEDWRHFHRALGSGLLDDLLTKTARPMASLKAAEVDVCIYHCKEDAALRRTLASLSAQEEKPTKVLIGLDCNVENATTARAVASEFDLNVVCLDCYQYDAGLSYNVLARHVESSFLLFLWSGSQLRPEALRALKRTALTSGAEVLNFFYRVVLRGDVGDSGYLNASILGSVTEAFFRSDLSPMPVMASVTAFRSLDGFSTDYRVLGCEQEFVARCQVQGVPSTTALMEMGSVEAWDPGWIKTKCYDQAVSYFRAIRPQIAAAPLALRDMMLLSKGLQAKAAVRKSPPRRSVEAKPIAKNRADTAFAKLFALIDAVDETKAASPPKVERGPPPAAVPVQSVAPKRRENEYLTLLRHQLHQLPGSDRFTGRLLAVHGMTMVGWVCDEQQLSRSVEIECLCHGQKLLRTIANLDLDTAMPIPSSLQGHAFRIAIPKPLLRGRVLGQPLDVTLRIVGESVILAVTSIGYRSLKHAGFDGHCEVVRPGIVSGWAWKADDPDTNHEVAIFVDGRFLSRVPCQRERDDLKAAGIGDGSYGFEFTVPKALRDGTRRNISVVIADHGVPLKSGRLLLMGDRLRLL